VDQSLFAVIMEAYLHGTSTRRVDDLVKALRISKSEVSRICADLDTEVATNEQPADAPDLARTTGSDESGVTNCSEQAGRPRGIYESEACLPGLRNSCATGSALTVIQSAP
jgi:hypothetical protein